MSYRKSFEVVGYTYEADVHCRDCAIKRFALDEEPDDFRAMDGDGNPVLPIFLDQIEETEHCGDCGAEID